MPLVNGRVCISVKCRKCGHDMTLQSASGGSYCNSCGSINFSTTHGEKFVDESQIVIQEEKAKFGLPYEFTDKCELCGGKFGSNLYMTDGTVLCSSCYSTKTVECSGCKTRHLKSNLKDGLCEPCRKSFKKCPSCGKVTDIRKQRLFECDDGKVRCNECARPYLNSLGTGMNYHSHKPRPVMFGDLTNEDYYRMGLELEMGGSRRLNEFIARSRCEEVYYKSDGSTSGWCSTDTCGCEGVEMVTHPCTLAYHMHDLPWDRILKSAVSCGYRGHTASTCDKTNPTCGLHVHVGVEAFGRGKERESRQAKLLVLFDKYWDKLVIFSRRDRRALENWCKRYSDIDISTEELETIIRKAKDGQNRSRYMAVNFQNETTVEFRLFRSTLNKETIFATLQLLHELIARTNLPTKEVQQLSWEDFCNETCEKYSEFKGYIERLRGMKKKI